MEVNNRIQWIQSRKQDIIELFNKQRGKCYLCGGQMKLRGYQNDPQLASIDHVYPKSKAYGVCVTKRAACQGCNADKGNKTVFDK